MLKTEKLEDEHYDKLMATCSLGRMLTFLNSLECTMWLTPCILIYFRQMLSSACIENISILDRKNNKLAMKTVFAQQCKIN
jgi:hypothetical protein